MSKLMSFALAGLTALALGAGLVRADPDKTDKPAAEKPAKVVAPLTDDSLKDMLENMGYDAKAEPVTKTVIYHLNFDQDDWTFHIDVALSTDKEQLWITTPVADFPGEDKVPAATLLRLLEETNDIGPSAVYYDKSIKRISVARALTNHGGLTPAIVRSHMNQFIGDVKAVKKICDDFPKPDAKTTADKKTDDKKKTEEKDKN